MLSPPCSVVCITCLTTPTLCSLATAVQVDNMRRARVDALEIPHTPTMDLAHRRPGSATSSSSRGDSSARAGALSNITAAIAMLARTRQQSSASVESVFLARLVRACKEPEVASKGRALLALLTTKDITDPVAAGRKEAAVVIAAGLLEEGRECSEDTLSLLLEEVELTVSVRPA